MQLYMRRWSSKEISQGADFAVLAWPVPADCTLNSISAEIHVSAAAAQPVANAHMIACQGWLLQSETGADYASMDTMWDKFVPKDDSPDILDASVVADADSVFEPGLTNMAQVFEQEIAGPERFYKYSKMLTIANMRQAGFVDSAQTYIPSDVIRVKVNKKYRVQDDSGAILALASPDVSQLQIPNNDVVVAVGGTARDSFYTLAHLEDFIHLAMINLTNMTEAGAEEPYENLFAFIEETLEQVQGTGALGVWAAIVFNSWSQGIAGIRTMKRTSVQTLGPDAQAQ